MSARLPHPLVWLAAAAPLMAGLELGRRILGNNDDARFAVLAQDVLAHGLRMFPELNGAPYYNKPALLAWLIALVSWPAGSVSQLTAALPSAAAAVALAFVVWALGRDMFGADAGWYAALVAVATQGFFLQARLPLPDMLMTLFITLALWQLWRMTRDGARGHHWLGFYGATALAFWSKGGAGFLPLAVALGWAVVNARDAGWRRLGLLRGLALLVLLIAPWWLFGLRTDRVAIRGAVVDNQLFWYLPFTLTLNSVTAPLRNAFGILFPWVLVVPLVLVQAVRCARGEDADRRDVRALLVWAAVTFVLIGASREQRFRYYLPLVPPAALLIGWWLARALPECGGILRVPWRLYGGLALVLAAVTSAALGGGRRRSEDLLASLPASLGEALVLAGGLGAMLVALGWGMQRARNAIGQSSDRYHQGRGAISRISRELQSAYVSLHLPGALSGTLGSAATAAADFPAVRVIDTGAVSAATTMLAFAVQRRLERGSSDEEVDELVTRFREEHGLLFTLDTLDYLARGGRVGRAAAFAGSLLSVKPILTIRDDEVVPLKRVRGTQKALGEFRAELEANSPDEPSLRIGLAHAAAPERLAQLEALVRAARPRAKVEVSTSIGPVLGTHAGPGAIGLFWFDDPVL